MSQIVEPLCIFGVLIAATTMLWFLTRKPNRDERQPRFSKKIPCDYCGDREMLENLSQCGGCGRLFCLGCIDPADDYHGLQVCVHCKAERKRICDAAFPHEFAKRQTAIYGEPTETTQ